MKIIKKFDIDAWTYFCKCQKCLSELEIDKNDLKFDDKDFIFNCPVCFILCVVARERIPLPIIESIKEKIS